MSSLVVAPDTLVTLSYVVVDEDGDTVEEVDDKDPLTYVHGYGQVIPGLEAGVAGMKAGEKRTFEVGPDEAFGQHDHEAVFEVDKADFPDASGIAQGDEFEAEGPDGHRIAMLVVEVLDDALIVDANHPLAGQTLRFEVSVSDVRAATEEEIATAQAELEAEIDDDACCDHDHGPGGHDHAHDHDDESGTPLLQLKKKS